MCTRTAAAILVAAAASIAAATAGARSRGANGLIAYSHPISSGRHHTTFVISVLNPDGSADHQLTRPPVGSLDEEPDFSPDGSKVAFQRCAPLPSRCAIYTIGADGRGVRRIGPSCKTKPPACEDRLAPAWSPDGGSIAYVREWGALKIGKPWGPQGQIANSDLYVMAADGTDVRRVTRLSAAKPYAVDLGRPTWSPDRKHVAFEVTESPRGTPAGKAALFIVGTDGSGLKRLTPWKREEAGHADFSPDGNEILFAASPNGKGGRSGNLFEIHPDGSGLQQLTHSPSNGIVTGGSFSPDGTSIAYAQLPPGEEFLTSLYVMAADGSGAHPIAPQAAAGDIEWGPASGISGGLVRGGRQTWRHLARLRRVPRPVKAS
jgi:Tol biopolymer transport system component